MKELRTIELEIIEYAINRLVKSLDDYGWKIYCVNDSDNDVPCDINTFLEIVRSVDESTLCFKRNDITASVWVTLFNDCPTECIYDYSMVYGFKDIVSRWITIFKNEEELKHMGSK